MTIALARQTLTTIIAGTTPTTNGLGLGARFVEGKQLGEDITARVGRSFYLWTTATTPRGYYSRTRANESLADIGLHVFYPQTADRARLDEIIEQDRVDLCDRILNETLWGRPSSGIINVASQGQRLLPTTRDTVAGGWESVITIALHYR